MSLESLCLTTGLSGLPGDHVPSLVPESLFAFSFSPQYSYHPHLDTFSIPPSLSHSSSSLCLSTLFQSYFVLCDVDLNPPVACREVGQVFLVLMVNVAWSCPWSYKPLVKPGRIWWCLLKYHYYTPGKWCIKTSTF